ncbi:MAG TPA: TIGR03013 family PEP-CTERM/XrtA system glycosyltransferase [Thiobacillaceae bacterium]|nr:TIGR03013 family PEP-CTERM/XrtA system glycosyltransferase [Thiobacillaceae bacterium]HNU63810.1 TIGR03013 family PEP-CTERM/XrtA system glycosyltransferase [Thiobacillaceae bacterium]
MIRFFRHYIPLSLALLAGAEFVLFFLVAHFSTLQHGEYGLDATSWSAYKPWLFAVLFSLLNSLFGLYGWEWTTGVKSLLIRILGSLLVGALILAAGASLVPGLFPSGTEFFVGMALVGFSAILVRLLFMEWGKTTLFKKRVLVVGTGSRAARIEDLANSGEAQGIHIVGYLPMGTTHSYVPHDRLIHDEDRLYDIALRHGVSDIIVAIRERRGGGLPIGELLECKLRGMEIVDLPAFFEQQTGILPLESTNASWIIFSEGFSQGSRRDVVKRAFDLMISGAFLLALFPLMLLTALLIRLESKGPVFYTQERVGQFGQPFTIYKFRSMRVDAEKQGAPVWARKNDDRTTRVGRLIRRTRIDELPQILNVFLGHMSFVGPRPERPYFVRELAEQIPYYHARHSVKPGITGWAQVRFPYGASVEDAMQKLQFDLYYVKNHSLFLDLMILLQTAQVVVLGKGVR